MDIAKVGDLVHESVELHQRCTLVDVDNNRRTGAREMSGDLSCTIEGGVGQHNEADGHAQFPLDISPVASIWRQPRKRSDHVFQRLSSALLASRNAVYSRPSAKC